MNILEDTNFKNVKHLDDGLTAISRIEIQKKIQNNFDIANKLNSDQIYSNKHQNRNFSPFSSSITENYLDKNCNCSFLTLYLF